MCLAAGFRPDPLWERSGRGTEGRDGTGREVGLELDINLSRAREGDEQLHAYSPGA